MKRILSITLAAFILLVSLASCQAPNNENDCPEQAIVEAGFGDRSSIPSGAQVPPSVWTGLFCAYRFDNCVYDSKNIKFNIFFSAVDRYIIEENVASTPVYVKIRNSTGTEIILHEFTLDEIYVDKYSMHRDENKRLVYNYSEEFTLTEELLSNDKGYVTIEIIQPRQEGKHCYGGSSVRFYYKVENDKVLISSKQNY